MSFKFPFVILVLLLVCESNKVACSNGLDDQLSELENIQRIISEGENIFQEIHFDDQKDDARFQESGKDSPFVHNEAPTSSVNQSLCINSSNFEEAIKSLGLLDGQGVSLVRVTNSSVFAYLKEYKEITIPRVLPTVKPVYHYRKRSRDIPNPHFKRPRDQESDVDDDDQESIQKRSERPICQDKVMDKYVLAHYHKSLAYRIDTHKCVGSECKSEVFKAGFGTSLGRCAQVDHSMNLFVVDRNRNTRPLTVFVGSACKCLSYYP